MSPESDDLDGMFAEAAADIADKALGGNGQNNGQANAGGGTPEGGTGTLDAPSRYSGRPLRRESPTSCGASRPLTGDNSSADFYCTIFTVAPSRLEKDTIWTGSDDGLVYVTYEVV